MSTATASPAAPSPRRHEDPAEHVSLHSVSRVLDDDDEEHFAHPAPSAAHSVHTRAGSSPGSTPLADDDARNSPDERYGLAHTPDAVAAARREDAKVFVPYRGFMGAGGFDGAGADTLDLEELEATSAQGDDDDASYNGGTTDEGEEDNSTDESSDGGEFSAFTIVAREDGGALLAATDDEAVGHNDDDDGDDIIGSGAEQDDAGFDDAASPCAMEPEHPFLDMDAQRGQVQWERHQQRAAYHAEMQRTVAFSHEDRARALQCLLNEAHRFHHRLAKSGRVAMPPQVWRGLAAEVEDDLVTSGPPMVQRNLSCMCIFSGACAAREYGDHEDDRNRRQANQHRTLSVLKVQGLRGEPSRFLTAAPDLIPPSSMSTAALSRSPPSAL